MRIFSSQSPFSEHDPAARWNERFTWPAWWVDNPAAGTPPFVCAYRLPLSFDSPQTLRFHVSADERYILYLDDQRLGRGPELGDPMNWFYESFETTITPGAHTFWAVVWSLGERRAEAQMSVQPGFLFAVEGEQVGLSTGLADWQTCPLPGWDFIDPMPAVWRGDRFRISAPFPELGRLHTLPWQPARRTTRAMDRIVDWDLHRKRRLQPATLLPLLSRIHRPGKVRSVSAPPTSERSAVQAIPLVEGSTVGGAAASLDDWQAFAAGAEITLPPHCIRRVVFDLQDYLVAYPEMIVSGGAGALIRLSWEESGRAAPDPWNTHKGHRDELAGKYLTGLADEYLPDGSAQARFAPLWWQAGRYLELLVATAGEPLTLHALALEETRYPLEMESDFQPADTRLRETLPLLVRGLQTNANEIIVDTPYYEEQQYTGDVLVQSLCHYVMSGVNRLVRKAIRLYDSSRLPDGFLQSRYPSHKTQLIAPYSLWWIHMLRDYLYWRDDPDFVRALLPGMRATLEAFRRHLSTHSGLLQAPYGWNIMDWVPDWDRDAGVPPDGLAGESALLNWQLVYALTLAADLETRAGEAAFAAHYAQWAGDLARVSFSAFWDETQGLLADDRAHTLFSEHTQVMAVL
ncbi:MAG: alpha-L-rhamnosidase, partial [Anaerolineae bacterium]|nr:alpha-L-rhamnosidase [Anaerolineae bacterium]